MSDYSTDMGFLIDPDQYSKYITNAKAANNEIYLANAAAEEARDNTSLTFEDMLMLMVTQLQNQTIDNQADTNDMMNQLIQMTVMQAITEMTTKVEDLTEANVMSYAASLVGKEVTVGVVDVKTGKLAHEIVGTVTATGTYNGQQVIFIGDKYYPLSSIMAVGTLPETAVDGSTNKPVGAEDGEDVDGVGDGEGTEETEEPDGTSGADTDDPDAADGAEDNEAEVQYLGEYGLPIEDD